MRRCASFPPRLAIVHLARSWQEIGVSCYGWCADAHGSASFFDSSCPVARWHDASDSSARLVHAGGCVVPPLCQTSCHAWHDVLFIIHPAAPALDYVVGAHQADGVSPLHG